MHQHHCSQPEAQPGALTGGTPVVTEPTTDMNNLEDAGGSENGSSAESDFIDCNLGEEESPGSSRSLIRR